MSSGQTKISALISDRTKQALDEYAAAPGIKKDHLIEAALLHHLQALRELPLDVIIPARLVVTEDSGQAVLQQIEKPQQPTRAMRELFGQ